MSEVTIEQLREAWERTIVPAAALRSAQLGELLAQARPAMIAFDPGGELRMLGLQFSEEPADQAIIEAMNEHAPALHEVLYEVTGERFNLAVVDDSTDLDMEIHIPPATMAKFREWATLAMSENIQVVTDDDDFDYSLLVARIREVDHDPRTVALTDEQLATLLGTMFAWARQVTNRYFQNPN